MAVCCWLLVVDYWLLFVCLLLFVSCWLLEKWKWDGQWQWCNWGSQIRPNCGRRVIRKIAQETKKLYTRKLHGIPRSCPEIPRSSLEYEEGDFDEVNRQTDTHTHTHIKKLLWTPRSCSGYSRIPCFYGMPRSFHAIQRSFHGLQRRSME